jgi:glycosyltransferase involved in cell wall biosynthesis
MMNIDFSILVGRVSTEDHDRILEALTALRRQEGNHTYQVVLADRLNDAVTDLIAANYPEVRLIACDANATLPAMRADALNVATGKYIIVTEDHCVPSESWLEAFYNVLQAAPDDVVAVGGCVENGVVETALDWATFLCEYSGSIAPAPSGIVADVPGMNVAYRRKAFDDIDDSVLRKGFWETTLHPVLRERGLKFFSSSAIKLYHCKKFSLRLFCRQRFVYSRYYAGIRYSRAQGMKRAAAAVMSLALPPLLLWRMRGNVARKNRLGDEFLRALPYLGLFTIIWAAGEIVGYIAGQGTALAEIE